MWRDHVRELRASDASLLEHFTCWRIGEPWAREVQAAIRNDLPHAIITGRSTAFGCFAPLDGALAGVATLVDPGGGDSSGIAYASILATSIDHRRQGVAREMKERVIAEARQRQHVALASTVHVDNAPMLALNRSLGASLDLKPPSERWAEPEYFSCMLRI